MDSISMSDVEKACKFVDHYCEEAAQPWKPEENLLHYTPDAKWIKPIKLINLDELVVPLPVLTERFKEAKTMSHGAFPEIRRAWAVLDGSLIVWSFDLTGSNVWQYADESSLVIDVALLKPQPGYFEDVQYIVVWVTCDEIFFAKVVEEQRLLEPMLMFPMTTLLADGLADGVTLTCIVCTGKGRIFVAGHNRHIYELIYACDKPYILCCTPTDPALTNFFNRFLFGADDDHVVEMVVDNQRQTLYTRTKKGKLEAYFLGMKGDSSIEKVGKVYSDQSVVSISPLSKLESKWSHAHLVALLSDGSRMYFSTGNGCSQTPDCLRFLTTKCPPSVAGEDGVYKKVEPAYCGDGTFFISRPFPHDTHSSVLVVFKDSTCTQVDYISALRELETIIIFTGRMLIAAEMLPTPDATSAMLSLYSQVLGESYETTCGILRGRGDLLTQHLLPMKQIVVFTTTVRVELFFNRPVDILSIILKRSHIPRVSLNAFIDHFGADETAAMCLMLASRIMLGAGEFDSLVLTRAADIFEDMKMERMPQLDATMAQDDLIHSAAHKGLYLCTSRLLYPLWNSCLFSKSSSENGGLICRFPTDAMHDLESKLRSLGNYLSGAQDSSGCELANGPPDIHDNVCSMESCRHLLMRSAEALFLLQILSRHDIAICTQRCEESFRQTLLQLEFRQLVNSEKDDQIAKVLISAIMESRSSESTRALLHEGCPSYSEEADESEEADDSEEVLDSEEAILYRRKSDTFSLSLRQRARHVNKEAGQQ